MKHQSLAKVLRGWSHDLAGRPLGAVTQGLRKEDLRAEAERAIAQGMQITVCRPSHRKPDLRSGRPRGY